MYQKKKDWMCQQSPFSWTLNFLIDGHNCIITFTSDESADQGTKFRIGKKIYPTENWDLGAQRFCALVFPYNNKEINWNWE